MEVGPRIRLFLPRANGVVKIKGSVDHHAAIFTLINDIEKIRGVVDVDTSQITVTKAQKKT